MNSEEPVVVEKKFNKQELLNSLLYFDHIFVPPFSAEVNLEQYAEKLLLHASFVCCMLEERVVGLLAYYKNQETKQLYIPYVCVDNSFQGRGIGSEMIHYLVNKYSQSFYSVALEVLKINKKGISFYKKIGFDVIEDRGEKFLLGRMFANSNLI